MVRYSNTNQPIELLVTAINQAFGSQTGFSFVSGLRDSTIIMISFQPQECKKTLQNHNQRQVKHRIPLAQHKRHTHTQTTHTHRIRRVAISEPYPRTAGTAHATDSMALTLLQSGRRAHPLLPRSLLPTRERERESMSSSMQYCNAVPSADFSV